ncbi:uncharacterized protein LOC143148852 [Ptiloglossa arizonensis]|uniref:uncharacterized protein LOC143148852 n=1 Tax=Ptiloglossa arizonensis TaxID=3350558 RepID=UPI003FA064A5
MFISNCCKDHLPLLTGRTDKCKPKHFNIKRQMIYRNINFSGDYRSEITRQTLGFKQESFRRACALEMVILQTEHVLENIFKRRILLIFVFFRYLTILFLLFIVYVNKQ